MFPERNRPGVDRFAVQEALQVVGQVLGRGIALLRRSFSRHFRQMVSRSRGTFGWSRAGGTGSSVSDLHERVQRRRRPERRPAGQHS